MDKNEKFLYDILSVLSDAGILQNLILVGGWCQRIYRSYYGDPPEIPALRTVDIDLLILNPNKILKKVDIRKIFSKLGLDEVYSYPEGYIKYVHPDLEVEFLVSEIGKGKNKPFLVEKLNTNAQRLRYLDIIEKYHMEINFHGLKLFLPQPAAFVINKYITSQRRKDETKKVRDLVTAKELGEYILQDVNQKKLLRKIFKSLKPGIQSRLHKIIKEQSEAVYNCLTN
jgi:hypothetical protein